MSTTNKRNHAVCIPVHWSPEQADAVFDFITLLEFAIWDLYDKDLIKLLQIQYIADQMAEEDNSDDFDDLPF